MWRGAQANDAIRAGVISGTYSVSPVAIARAIGEPSLIECGYSRSSIQAKSRFAG